jgi:histone deacetylase 6
MAVMRVLLGEPLPSFPPLTANVEATETVYQVARFQSKYWKNIKAPALEAKPGKPDRSPGQIPHIFHRR